jgi:hypothetical protein
MAKRHLRAQLQQPDSLSARQVIHRSTDLRRRANEERRLPRRVGSRQQQQPLGLGRQLPHAPPEAGLDPAWQRPVAR